MIGAAEDQECKEAFLAFYFLCTATSAPNAGELEATIERWLAQAFGLDLAFTGVAEALTAKNYLVKPRVSTEVTNYRPFSILGEVNHPGEYPYENGMTVLNAVALAGVGQRAHLHGRVHRVAQLDLLG